MRCLMEIVIGSIALRFPAQRLLRIIALRIPYYFTVHMNHFSSHAVQQWIDLCLSHDPKIANIWFSIIDIDKIVHNLQLLLGHPTENP